MVFKNDKAVSPVVATLVLVVVAIIGAAAVGALLGAFSSDVSDEASAGETSSASSAEILIAGSTTVQPVSELLAEAFMEDHKGVKVTVQAGGSGAGVSSAGMGIVDIGAASRAVKDDEAAKYPDLQTHQIGGSAVVVIGNYATGFNVTQDELYDAYMNNDPTAITTGTVNTLYQRAEESGTEDTFVEWLEERDDNIDTDGDGTTDDNDEDTFSIDGDVEGATGNQGLLEAVAGTANSIGFVDFGYAEGSSDVVILGIVDDESGNTYGYDAIDSDAILDELADGNGDAYVTSLTRPLNYITNGEPNTMQQSFITFAQSPGAAEYFEAVGYFPITAFA